MAFSGSKLNRESLLLDQYCKYVLSSLSTSDAWTAGALPPGTIEFSDDSESADSDGSPKLPALKVFGSPDGWYNGCPAEFKSWYGPYGLPRSHLFVFFMPMFFPQVGGTKSASCFYFVCTGLLS